MRSEKKLVGSIGSSGLSAESESNTDIHVDICCKLMAVVSARFPFLSASSLFLAASHVEASQGMLTPVKLGIGNLNTAAARSLLLFTLRAFGRDCTTTSERIRLLNCYTTGGGFCLSR